MSEQGIAFPFRFDPRTGGVQESAGLDRIRESLQQILGIRLGERFRRPEYGSRLKDLVFEGNDPALAALTKHWVIDAIKRWEDRVIIEDVRFAGNQDAGELQVVVQCRINNQYLEIISPLLAKSFYSPRSASTPLTTSKKIPIDKEFKPNI